ncbi:MmgE/PrpD family protein [Alcaligenaceae bacterium]|nr:MmgE/PrpD family protein [Alcaligenaceae bacterium]
MMTVQLSSELGCFVSSLRYEDIPSEALRFIHYGFADCIAVMIAGRNETPPTLMQAILKPSAVESTVLFRPHKTSAQDAAWINGVAAHVLDYDDVALRGHPSCVLVPAIIAEAEALGAGGKKMMTAYAAGYETWAELVRRDPDQHHTKGWHPTGIFGAIAAAAACASLRGLNAQQATHAICLGASQSAGLMANFGSMTKSYHAGRSAHSGVISARLAHAGFTASPDGIEHPQGFLAAVSPLGNVDLSSPIEAGAKWKLPRSRISIKKYPTCFATHRAIDGILDLLKVHAVRPNQVKKVNASVSRRNTAILRNHSPQTGLAAKFSMEFAMASALIAGRVTLAELTDEFVSRQDVQDLMKRVTVIPDDRMDPNPNANGYAIYDQVTIETVDGRNLAGEQINLVRGGADRPLEQSELWDKFQGCLTAGDFDQDLIKPLFQALMTLEHCSDARALVSQFSATP